MGDVVLQLLTHGRADTLPALFESLLAQVDREWSLKVLVNGAADSIREEIFEVVDFYRTRLPMTVDVSEENLGFAGGHQWLFERHQAPYVVLVNDDVVLAPDYIAQLRGWLDEYPKTAAVSGKLVRPDGRIDSLGLHLSLSGKVSNIAEGEVNDTGTTQPYKVFGVAGTLPMLRRGAVVSASHDGRLFDLAFGSYKEDVELAFRFRFAQWDCVVIPTAVAVHHRTFRRSRLHRGVSWYAAAHSYRNHLWNLLTFYSWTDYLRRGWAILPFELSKLAFLLLTHPRVIPWALFTTRDHWGILMAKRRHFV